MPTSNLERTLKRFRNDLLRRERQAASAMVRTYGTAWQNIQTELERLQAEYEGAERSGQKPSISWIYEYNRARAFRDQVERELLQFAQYAEGSTQEQMQAAIRAAEEHAETLMHQALGKAPAGIAVNWNRIPMQAVEEMVGLTRPDSPLHVLLLSMGGEGAQAAEDALVQGLLLGYNPRETGRLVRKALGGTLWQALRISRTETLRAYREATRQNYQANQDILKGWIWNSAADERTCAMCWAMHGTVHKLTEQLDDHPNGRCAMIPLTKSWQEIGQQMGVDLSGVPEAQVEIEPGAKLFERLPDEKQIKILGPAKWAAWKDGAFSLDDLVGRKISREWGTHRYERSLKEILGEEKAKKYTRLALLGVARDAGNYSADDLIQIAGLGLRELTPRELNKVIEHVAKAGFEKGGQQKVQSMLSGQVWNGKVLEKGDIIEPGIAHYLKHVSVSNEWPEHTSYEDYLNSLKEIIQDKNSDIFVSKFDNEWQIGFVGESGKWKGQQGYSHIFVEYKVKYRYWITGFQPKDISKQVLEHDTRKIIIWLRNLHFK